MPIVNGRGRAGIRKSSAAPSIVTNGLLLSLDAGNVSSYPGTGTLWSDISGNGNNGTLTNGPVYNSANGGSILFDGANDYCQLANPSFTNQMTIEFWTNLSAPTSTYGYLCGRESAYRIIYTSSNFQFVCSTVNNSWYSAGTFIQIGTPIISNKYHLVCTYNGSRLKAYLNGALVSTSATNISGNVNNSGFASQYTYAIMRDFGTAAGTIGYAKGNVYAHRVYNRALSDAEVAQNFNATKSRYGIA